MWAAAAAAFVVCLFGGKLLCKSAPRHMKRSARFGPTLGGAIRSKKGKKADSFTDQSETFQRATDVQCHGFHVTLPRNHLTAALMSNSSPHNCTTQERLRTTSFLSISKWWMRWYKMIPSNCFTWGSTTYISALILPIKCVHLAVNNALKIAATESKFLHKKHRRFCSFLRLQV